MKQEERVSFVTCAELLNRTSDLWKSSPNKNRSGFACAVFRKISRSATGRTRPRATRQRAKLTSTTQKDTVAKCKVRLCPCESAFCFLCQLKAIFQSAARRGFAVHAVTGRPQEAGYLKGLGAAEIVDREELAVPAKPLAKERWAGAIDAVGR